MKNFKNSVFWVGSTMKSEFTILQIVDRIRQMARHDDSRKSSTIRTLHVQVPCAMHARTPGGTARQNLVAPAFCILLCNSILRIT